MAVFKVILAKLRNNSQSSYVNQFVRSFGFYTSVEQFALVSKMNTPCALFSVRQQRMPSHQVNCWLLVIMLALRFMSATKFFCFILVRFISFPLSVHTSLCIYIMASTITIFFLSEVENDSLSGWYDSR